jgi:hypothetical protein
MDQTPEQMAVEAARKLRVQIIRDDKISNEVRETQRCMLDLVEIGVVSVIRMSESLEKIAKHVAYTQDDGK